MRRTLWLLLLAVVHTGLAQAAQNLTVGHIGVAGIPHEMEAKMIVSKLEARLPGRFRIDHQAGSTLGSELDIWEGLKLGTVDIALLTAATLTPQAPMLGVLSVPFLFRDSEHAGRVLNGPVGQQLADSLKPHGVIVLGFGEHGFRHLSNSRWPVSKPSDLEGLRIRVIPNPIFEATFKTLGAAVVPMDFPRLYGALDDGRLDGQENPLLSFSGSHFERVQKYLSLTGHIYSSAVILVNAKMFYALTPAERKVLSDVVRETVAETRPMVMAKDNEIVASLTRLGVKVVVAVDRPAFEKALEPLWPEWEKRFGADLLKRIRETR